MLWLKAFFPLKIFFSHFSKTIIFVTKYRILKFLKTVWRNVKNITFSIIKFTKMYQCSPRELQGEAHLWPFFPSLLFLPLLWCPEPGPGQGGAGSLHHLGQLRPLSSSWSQHLLSTYCAGEHTGRALRAQLTWAFPTLGRKASYDNRMTDIEYREGHLAHSHRVTHRWAPAWPGCLAQRSESLPRLQRATDASVGST